MPDGKFESWWPTEVPIWVNISPFQVYKQEVYDREAKEVVEVETTWFEYYSHWVPARKRKFVCSCGAHRTEPCYGCARRAMHWDRLDRIEEEKGIRPDEKPDVGRAVNFGLGVTIMEKIYSIPKQDKQGKIMKSKAGKVIYNNMPSPLIEEDDLEGVNYPTKFGHRAHWSVGVEQRDQLLEFDAELRCRCASCAGHLFATARICPDCETSVEFAEPLGGEDLMQLHAKQYKCKACSYQGGWVPKYACPDCGAPQEGGLTKFDIRIKRSKVGEKYVLKLTDIRVPSQDEEVQKLVQNPLKLDEIFAPDPINVQKSILGDKAKGVDPAYGSFGEDKATDYTSNDSDDSEQGIQF